MRATSPDEERQTGKSPTLPLRARLFGELDLWLGEERLGPLGSARARSLLGYLLLHGDVPHSRQRLAFLLWPDSTEPQARTNLRNVLHTMRRTSPQLERVLEVTPRTLSWRTGARCWVDVAEFTSALDEAEAAEPGSDRMIAGLRSAIDLYVGDLLEECFDEWLIEERERVRDRYVSALRRLCRVLADRAQHAEAIRLGQELARCDPLDEDTYRLLMNLHEAAGDRSGALRVYHACAATLQRELGVEPSAPTRDAYAALTRSDRTSTDTDRVPVGGADLVGRDSEWDRLTRCWRDAEDGRPRLVVVTGEPGVGKTRLVEELGRWCVHRGAVVAHGRAYPGEGDLGYGMAISWLRSAHLAPHLRRASPADVAELARILPELGPLRETVPTPTDEAERRRRLFDAIARTVGASGRPTLLIADDAQWSDAQSLQLIHYLVRVATDNPLLVVATVRREDLDDGHPLTGLIGALQIIDRTDEIGLARLTRAETEALACRLTGNDIDPRRAADLFAETEGNPLFIVESIRAGGGVDRVGLSPKVQAVISARLRQLSEPAHDLIGVAAAVGRAFTAALVASASQVEEGTLVRGLDELWRRGAIREHGHDSYDFSHGKIRDVAYEALSPATRRRTHLLIAEALQRLHESDLESVSGQVAGHYDRAGRVGDALTWYQRAAVQAQRLGASAEAVRLLDRAHELVPGLPAESRQSREFEVLSALPTALVGVEGFASTRVVEAQQRATELAGLLGVDVQPPLLRSLVMSSLCRKDFDRALTAATQFRSSAERAGDHGLLIESDYLLGIAALWGERLDLARTHFEHAVDAFRAEQRAEHLVRFGHDPKIVCLSRLGNTLWFLGRVQEARRASARALTMATEVGHPFSRGLAHVFAALLALDLGETDQLRAHVAALRNEHDQARPNEMVTQAFVAFADVLDGRADDGIRRIQALVGSCEPVDRAPALRVVLTRVLLAAFEAAGDPQGGLIEADEALRLDGTRLWEAETRRLRATFLAAVGGQRREVEAELARAAAVARRQGALGPGHRIELSRSQLGLAD